MATDDKNPKNIGLNFTIGSSSSDTGIKYDWSDYFADPVLANEKTYLDIVCQIVDISKSHLNKQTTAKEKLRDGFARFFKILIAAQLIFLAFLLTAGAFCPIFKLGDAIIITYISSVFVETLGAVIYMITYAFNSKDETEAIGILNSIVSDFQKSSQKDNK